MRSAVCYQWLWSEETFLENMVVSKLCLPQTEREGTALLRGEVGCGKQCKNTQAKSLAALCHNGSSSIINGHC